MESLTSHLQSHKQQLQDQVHDIKSEGAEEQQVLQKSSTMNKEMEAELQAVTP